MSSSALVPASSSGAMVPRPSDGAHTGQKVASAVAAARKAEDEAKRLEEQVATLMKELEAEKKKNKEEAERDRIRLEELASSRPKADGGPKKAVTGNRKKVREAKEALQKAQMEGQMEAMLVQREIDAVNKEAQELNERLPTAQASAAEIAREHAAEIEALKAELLKATEYRDKAIADMPTQITQLSKGGAMGAVQAAKAAAAAMEAEQRLEAFRASRAASGLVERLAELASHAPPIGASFLEAAEEMIEAGDGLVDKLCPDPSTKEKKAPPPPPPPKTAEGDAAPDKPGGKTGKSPAKAKPRGDVPALDPTVTQRADQLTGELTRLLVEWARLEARVPELPAGNKILPNRHPGIAPHTPHGGHGHGHGHGQGGDQAVPPPHPTECDGCLRAPAGHRKEVLKKRLHQLGRAQAQAEAEERGSNALASQHEAKAQKEIEQREALKREIAPLKEQVAYWKGIANTIRTTWVPAHMANSEATSVQEAEQRKEEVAGKAAYIRKELGQIRYEKINAHQTVDSKLNELDSLKLEVVFMERKIAAVTKREKVLRKYLAGEGERPASRQALLDSVAIEKERMNLDKELMRLRVSLGEMQESLKRTRTFVTRRLERLRQKSDEAAAPLQAAAEAAAEAAALAQETASLAARRLAAAEKEGDLLADEFEELKAEVLAKEREAYAAAAEARYLEQRAIAGSRPLGAPPTIVVSLGGEKEKPQGGAGGHHHHHHGGHAHLLGSPGHRLPPGAAPQPLQLNSHVQPFYAGAGSTIHPPLSPEKSRGRVPAP